MDVGGAWCPNQQAASLPTRANERVENARRGAPGREKAKISAGSPSIVKISCEPFIVNLKESTGAGSATNALLSAELNRRLHEKSIPLLPIWAKKLQVPRAEQHPGGG